MFILELTKVFNFNSILVGPVEHCYPDWKEGVNKAYWGVKDMPPESATRVHLEMKAGDIVFFHPYLFHGSGENKVRMLKLFISHQVLENQFVAILHQQIVNTMILKELFMKIWLKI